MKIIVYCLALIMLVGCAPEIVNKPVPVNIPISVPCKAPMIPIPIFATDGINDKDTLFSQVRSLAATNEQRKAFEAQLIAANRSCN